MHVQDNDIHYLEQRCDAYREEATKMRLLLERLEREAARLDRNHPNRARDLFDRLVAWAERAQRNTAALDLIRTTARGWAKGTDSPQDEHQRSCRRLARRAQAPLRRDAGRAAALLIRLRADYRLKRVNMPVASRASFILPSGREIRREIC